MGSTEADAQLGLDVAWRKEAWWVWWRFQQGKQTVPEHPRQWVSLCQQVALKQGCPITKVEEQVAQWAGVHLRQEGPCQQWAGVHLRQEGPCQQVPTAQRVEFKCTADGLRRKQPQVI